MMIYRVKKITRLQIDGQCEPQTYKDGELIYDLMMDTLIEDFVNSLEDNIGQIVKSEMADGTVCGELFKHIYRMEETVRQWLGLELEEGEISTLIDNFYRLLNVTTVHSYQTAFESDTLDEREDFNNQVTEIQRLNYKMVEAGIKITQSLNADKVKIIEELLTMCTKVILIFAQRARAYGAFFRQYETLKSARVIE